ncbi:glycosyltransferase family 2 protein [Seonamhaeicola sp. ML3]|uniref:glycosyltransferase family 2 protein n=1 Tax=Seonamhaeicola sp. ML3 TaxID=2937786 RepID=UPI00200D9D28|nr:glycosyltransferase family 2 protein [Seonamhaeicola sp. ML3]
MEVIISIIIPIYNTEHFLERCLDSVQNQTFKDFEVILVDDGSTDNSKTKCSKYVEGDSRFKYFYQNNKGRSSAINLGYTFTRGKYMLIIDSDDHITPNLLDIAYSTSIHHSVDIVNYSHYYVKDGFEEKCQSPLPKDVIIDNDTIKDLLKTSFPDKHKLLWFTWLNLIKKDLLDTHNILHDESVNFCVDSIFNLECFLNAEKIYSISDPLYYYEYNEYSMTQEHYKSGLLQKITNQFLARISIHEKYNLTSSDYKSEIASYYIEHSLFFILNNEKKSPKKLDFKILSEIRKSMIYDFSFDYYKKYSAKMNLKQKTIVFLFKHNRLKILAFLLRLFTNNSKIQRRFNN